MAHDKFRCHLYPPLCVELPVPEEMAGRSVLPLLRGQKEERKDEVFIQVSESQVGRALRTSRWKYAVAAPAEDGGKVPAADPYVETHLYDLHADPYELTNLAGLEPFREVADRLRDKLLQHIGIVERVQPTILRASV